MQITASGLSTAFGKGLAAIIAAAEEDLLPLARRSDFIGADFRPQLCAFAPGATLDGAEARMRVLVAEALQDLGESFAALGQTWPAVGLVLLTPCGDPGLEEAQAQAIAGDIVQELRNSGWIPPDGPVVALRGDAATVVPALRAAAELTAQGRPVLLIAADSFCCRRRLNALCDANGLFSRDNPWGLVPGEAAIAALVEADAATAPAMQVAALAEAEEPVPAQSERDSAFTGLSDAALAVLDQAERLGLAAPQALFSDWNNSRYRASELSYAMVRMTGLLAQEGIEPIHPAQRFGHVGAGWLATAWATAREAAAKGAAGPALVLCGNERDGGRGAFILQWPAAAEVLPFPG
ncbi:hypothetical protein [Paracoccus aminovorans]|uniref:hypothetical protein n=1 Tax=Paracoccus aminovorans TaxID=34004 RepID=UPI002B25AD19|nr:hypothetical protein [Paracoccus aminovorans]